jgi:phenylacetate-CoA ligase
MTAEANEVDMPLGVSFKEIRNMMGAGLSWSGETLQGYQHNQLEQLLRHARQHVPFYRTRLDCLFTGNDQVDWSRWQDVPILKRADLRLHPDLLLSDKNPPSHGAIQTATSSGSTGVPVTVTFPQLFTFVAKAAWERFRALHGINYAEGVIDFALKLPDHAEPDAEHCAPRDGEHVYFIRRNLPVERKLHWLAQSTYRYLQDVPNHLEIMARANLRAGKPVKLAAVCGIGMAMSEEQRVLFFESFGAKSIMPYSSKEGSLMAFECPHTPRHYHTCPELGLLEVVDESGRAVPNGQSGRSIITPFFNSAQPLIRYEQGDIVMSGSHCAGGIHLPVLAQIVGRKDAAFSFSNGDTTFIGIDVATVRDLLSADAFQLAQIGPNDVEVRYVSTVTTSHENQSSVSEHLLHLAGFPLTLTYRRMGDLPYNSGGKQQRLVNEYNR